MVQIDANRIDDTLPCRHTSVDPEQLAATKKILTHLHETSGDLLSAAGIDSAQWPPLLRAAIESMRGTSAATETDKRRFVVAVLDFCRERGVVSEWRFIGTGRRQDYQVVLSDGTQVAIEAKGCPDGNNTTIWDRPTWADEFIVWSLCPESLQHNPGRGAWSGVATRLSPKIAAERKLVDAFIFWDGRCGTPERPCPKQYGVTGELRAKATDYEGPAGYPDWVPPPCIFLFPRSVPTVPHNLSPPAQTIESAKFADALLTAFNVPDWEKAGYVHQVQINAKGSREGTEILISAVSRCWPDGDDRVVKSDWKVVGREA
ncbi:hypothetical protein [Mycobacterium sp. E2497]|uniref:hypothetical protein n=1 Tax=Mycobacterium sp. E2497 TaxID=1834135 RepID=UPI0007FC917C|nr:hypothetical protein [Mycobacterium sp. E2497]OBI11835.1 hypothetical protein A5713_05815 [Mycobacterium sp. E2497]